MSIKNKKDPRTSKNNYRWVYIENYLISKGYVLIDKTKDLRIWVDCVGNGRDIRYTLSNPSLHVPVGLPYEVMCTHSGSGEAVYKVCGTVLQAVEVSRHNARWDM